MSEANKLLIRKWFDEVWNNGRTETIDELMVEDAVVHGLSNETGDDLIGPAAFREFHSAFYNAFPGIKVSVDDTVAEGDKVAARCTVTATHTGHTLGFSATQRPVSISGMAIVRVKDGKIVEAWNSFDFLTLYQQLGVLSPIATHVASMK